MNVNKVYKIISKCLKQDEEFKAYYDSVFEANVEEENDLIFMISKDSNLSNRFKKVLGDGNVQISYFTYLGGTLSIRAEFEFGKWFSKIKENADFAYNFLGYKFKSKIEDHENDFGYDNAFEISKENVDDNLEKEIDEMLLIFAFVLDA